MALMKITPIKASERLKSLTETPLYVKALIYGNSGAGKTWLACTAKNPLLILSEWAVARPTLAKLHIDFGIDPDTIYVNSLADFDDAYDYAAAHAADYSTIVVDGLTDLNDRAMDEILVENTRLAALNDRVHVADRLEIGDWGQVANRTLKMARKFRDLPCDVVMTALSMDVKQEMFTIPMLVPKTVQKRIAAYFNFVGFLDVDITPNKLTQRKLYINLTNIYQAKNPGGALEGVIVNPHMGQIITQVHEYLTKPNAPIAAGSPVVDGDMIINVKPRIKPLTNVVIEGGE